MIELRLATPGKRTEQGLQPFAHQGHRPKHRPTLTTERPFASGSNGHADRADWRSDRRVGVRAGTAPGPRSLIKLAVSGRLHGAAGGVADRRTLPVLGPASVPCQEPDFRDVARHLEGWPARRRVAHDVGVPAGAFAGPR